MHLWWNTHFSRKYICTFSKIQSVAEIYIPQLSTCKSPQYAVIVKHTCKSAEYAVIVKHTCKSAQYAVIVKHITISTCNKSPQYAVIVKIDILRYS